MSPLPLLDLIPNHLSFLLLELELISHKRIQLMNQVKAIVELAL